MNWEEIYNTYSGDVLRTAYLMLKSRACAEDVCHEVFLRCLVHMPQIDHDKLHAYLIKAAVNKCKDILKSGYEKLREDWSDSLEHTSSMEGHEKEVVQAVLSLSEDLRNVFIIHDYQCFTLKETAKILRIPQGTASSRLNKARKELAVILTGA